MTSPTWFFDGDKRRIYEVPPGAGYTLSPGGLRVYDQGAGTAIMAVDVKRDLWSRWVDWMAAGNDWSLPAFDRQGGNLRPTGEFASVDFTLITTSGWRLVLANYPHETILAGNLFPQGADSLFDFTPITANGVVPRLQGSANLLTYNLAGGSGQPAAAIADAVWAKIIEGGLTAEQIMRIMLAVLAGNRAGIGSAAEQYMGQDGTTPRVIFTPADAAGNGAVVVDVA